MRVLNIEDDAIKHSNICKALNRHGIVECDWVKNLEDAIKMVRDHKTDYELIITDMFYPLNPGGDEVEAGFIFIREMKEKEIAIPIIVCSSVSYQVSDVLGTVHYSEKIDWEKQLGSLILRCIEEESKHF